MQHDEIYFSLAEGVIISVATSLAQRHHCQRRHHLKRALPQKSSFYTQYLLYPKYSIMITKTYIPLPAEPTE
jgi:IS1 family transposase